MSLPRPTTDARRQARDLEAAGRSHTGVVRRRNEDLFVCEPEHGLFAVIDGMGGTQAGQVAARTVFDTLLASPAEDLRDLLDRAHREIHAQGEENPELDGMGAVATTARLDRGYLQIAHVGDTRALVASRTGCEQLTRDHTVVADLEENLAMTEAEAGRLTGRHRVTRDLGGALHPDRSWIDLAESRLEPGDLLLLCSDGLSDLVPDGELFARLDRARQEGTEVASLAATLVDLALDRGAPDNVTVVVVRRTEAEVDPLPVPEIETTAVVAVDPAILEGPPTTMVPDPPTSPPVPTALPQRSSAPRRPETGVAARRSDSPGRSLALLGLVLGLLGIGTGWWLGQRSPESSVASQPLEEANSTAQTAVSAAARETGEPATADSSERVLLEVPPGATLTVDGQATLALAGIGATGLRLGAGATLEWRRVVLDAGDLSLRVELAEGAHWRLVESRLHLDSLQLVGPASATVAIDSRSEVETASGDFDPGAVTVQRADTQQDPDPPAEPPPPTTESPEPAPPDAPAEPEPTGTSPNEAATTGAAPNEAAATVPVPEDAGSEGSDTDGEGREPGHHEAGDGGESFLR